jgi:hypothetical protein
VYFKSLADRFGADVRIQVMLAASHRSPEAVRVRIDRALRHLQSALAAAGLSAAVIEPGT